MSVDINKLKETFQPVALPVVVSKAVETVQPHATRKAIEIQPSLAEPLPSIQRRRRQPGRGAGQPAGQRGEVLASRTAQITVRVEAQGSQVLIAVTDTGVGIAKEDLPHLFQDFGRGQTATRRA